MESDTLQKQDDCPCGPDCISRRNAILCICEGRRPNMRYRFQRHPHCNDSILQKNGINYDQPLTPMEIARKRAERGNHVKQAHAIVTGPRLGLPTNNSDDNSDSWIQQNIQSRNGGNFPAAPIDWCICMLNKNEVATSHHESNGSYYITSSNDFDCVFLRAGSHRESYYSNGVKCKFCNCVRSSSSCSDNENTDERRIGCCVCFDDVQQISNSKRHLMATFCGHIFCNSCIDTVIKNNPFCPVCRKKIIKKFVHKIYL